MEHDYCWLISGQASHIEGVGWGLAVLGRARQGTRRLMQASISGCQDPTNSKGQPFPLQELLNFSHTIACVTSHR